MSDNTAVFYDTEFTTWKGAMENGWSAPGQHREIVQIAALRIDLDTFRTIDEFDIFVRPVKNPVLSDYFIDLTGITNEQIEKHGTDFATAMQKFQDYAGRSAVASYGADHDVINENYRLLDIGARFEAYNINPWFMEHGRDYGIVRGVNSGKLAATLGITVDAIQEHNALHDVRSIAASYHFLISKGAPPFFGDR